MSLLWDNLPDRQGSRAAKVRVVKLQVSKLYYAETLRKNMSQDLLALSWRNNPLRKDGADWKHSAGFTDSS